MKFQILGATQSPQVRLCLEDAGERDVEPARLVGEVASGAASTDEAADRLIEQRVPKGR